MHYWFYVLTLKFFTALISFKSLFVTLYTLVPTCQA